MSYFDPRGHTDVTVPLQRGGWISKKLAFGDFDLDSFGESVLIEYKKVYQLLQDFSGQLQRQCRGMAENSRFPILLIEGLSGLYLDDSGYIAGTRYRMDDIRKGLLSIQFMGIKLVLTGNADQTIETLWSLEKWFGKEIHESVLSAIPGDKRLASLSLISGVGQSKGKALQAIFPNLRSVASASIEQLEDAEGIGRTLAKRIFDYYNEPWREVKI